MLNLQFNQLAADLTLDAHEVQGVVLVRHVVFEVVVPKLLNIGDLFAEFPLALEKAIDGDFVFNSIVHGELDLCSLHAGDGGPLLATHHRRPRAESHGFHQLTWVFQLAAGVVLQLPRQLQKTNLKKENGRVA